jgi:hypothetical protein
MLATCARRRQRPTAVATQAGLAKSLGGAMARPWASVRTGARSRRMARPRRNRGGGRVGRRRCGLVGACQRAAFGVQATGHCARRCLSRGDSCTRADPGNPEPRCGHGERTRHGGARGSGDGWLRFTTACGEGLLQAHTIGYEGPRASLGFGHGGPGSPEHVNP